MAHRQTRYVDVAAGVLASIEPRPVDSPRYVFRRATGASAMRSRSAPNAGHGLPPRKRRDTSQARRRALLCAADEIGVGNAPRDDLLSI
jgi:hypothetical protein